MKRLLRYLILPSEVSRFEERYLRRMNRIALTFFWIHVPMFMIVAELSGTSVMLALGLTVGVVTGPTLAYFGLSSRPRTVSAIYGLTAMIMGGVLVYVGQGPMQIEMHFYFFVLIALLAVFANPMVIVIAAVTVAAHHLVVWLVLPSGVFNYEASIWTVAVHALFVVLESVAACFVARSFFDNVIGLERLVAHRTSEVDARNRDMAMILENVAQGFVTVELDGTIGSERSRALTRWFGIPAAETRLWTYLAAHDPNLEAWIELAFTGIQSQLLPIETALAQLPSKLLRDGRQFRIEYRTIDTPATMLLVVITDITAELARERAEGAQRELIAVVERAYRDRAGFLAFIRDADDLVRASVTTQDEPIEELKRRIHTLKGNAALFGVSSVAEVCDELETRMDEECAGLDAAGRALLHDTWQTFHGRIDRLLGVTQRRSILVDWEEYQQVLASIVEPEPKWAASIREWGQEATRPYLERFGDQAQQLARRLGKAEIDVEIFDNNLRVDADTFAPIWPVLVHTVRNAIDHGIETTADRVLAGKSARGRVTFRTATIGAELHITISDDGAGLAWDRIAARAWELGIPAYSRDDLAQAVFASGLSTASEITVTSGRGVGMGALRATCVALGGNVELTTERGQGTTVRCRLPLPTSVARAPRDSSYQHSKTLISQLDS